ncbi:MAG: tetratricopeptide repeat protein [Clostridia bacterium]
MNRTARFKIMNFIFISLIVFITIYFYKTYRTPLAFLLPVLLLAIINIINKFAWKKFVEGRKLTQQKKYSRAIEVYNSFLDELEKKPILNYLMYLTIRIYSTSLKAIIYNDIASCYINLSQLKEAKEAVTQSLQQDELYAMPYYNLAIINIIEGETANAQRNLEETNKLGFKTVDFETLQRYILEVYTDSPQSDN